ncbi:MAG: hypothetical protein OXI81_19925 [Paracoccaceae bacterium]|nr:hypothetical protein [Paracoccaceae bacterium]
MPRHRGTVLVDTNVILEAYRSGSWLALAGGYDVETVEACVTETQTGFQRRRPERQIDVAGLRESLAAVHGVARLDRARLAVRAGGIFLDEGEAALWAHALGRHDDWVLCGPDKASLRCGVTLGFRQRLVSLEGLLEDVGLRAPIDLREAYGKHWHERTVGELLLAEKNGTD